MFRCLTAVEACTVRGQGWRIVTAGVEGIAAQDAFDGEPTASRRTMQLNAAHGVS